ncbi:DUF2537 domain-containing protein [Haloechinothrix sp. LS1_15]|uniref:DUF2537 domain-containing protein n=1 Tax=Haloechinothrix sp. LS1_15 TaxID=2652248 RepID=UPI00294767D2|nr:DUF2537 domain-containing protein [Haloechinothrix sp. LS1_15]MDV6014363.1 DUF2537 domain-containing protein [Haloechinothrix sp. LS1_15]
MTEARVELRVRDGRAVLAERAAGDRGGEHGSDEHGEHGNGAREFAPESLPLGAELAAALHEWARVTAAVQQGARGQHPELEAPGEDAIGMISRRGRQLAGRVASRIHTPVHVVDPVTGQTSVAVPEPRHTGTGPRHASPRGSRLFRRSPGEPPPWGPGLTVSAFTCAIVIVGMLALGGATGEPGWLSLGAALVVTVGLAPSLWLGKSVPVLRWMCLGATAGLAFSWIALLVAAL